MMQLSAGMFNESPKTIRPYIYPTIDEVPLNRLDYACLVHDLIYAFSQRIRFSHYETFNEILELDDEKAKEIMTEEEKGVKKFFRKWINEYNDKFGLIDVDQGKTILERDSIFRKSIIYAADMYLKSCLYRNAFINNYHLSSSPLSLFIGWSMELKVFITWRLYWLEDPSTTGESKPFSTDKKYNKINDIEIFNTKIPEDLIEADIIPKDVILSEEYPTISLNDHLFTIFYLIRNMEKLLKVDKKLLKVDCETKSPDICIHYNRKHYHPDGKKEIGCGWIKKEIQIEGKDGNEADPKTD